MVLTVSELVPFEPSLGLAHFGARQGRVVDGIWQAGNEASAGILASISAAVGRLLEKGPSLCGRAVRSDWGLNSRPRWRW